MRKLLTKYRNCPLCGCSDVNLFKTINSINIVKCISCQMVFVDIDENISNNLNQYPEETLFYYYKNEPIYTVAYYDDLLLRIEKRQKQKRLKF